MRATRSVARLLRASSWAQALSSSSPALWPPVSLTSFSPSTSKIAIEVGAPLRERWSSSRRSASSHAARLATPVRASVRTRCESAAFSSASSSCTRARRITISAASEVERATRWSSIVKPRGSGSACTRIITAWGSLPMGRASSDVAPRSRNSGGTVLAPRRSCTSSGSSISPTANGITAWSTTPRSSGIQPRSARPKRGTAPSPKATIAPNSHDGAAAAVSATRNRVSSSPSPRCS